MTRLSPGVTSVIRLSLDFPVTRFVIQRITVSMPDILSVTFVDLPGLFHLITGLVTGFSSLDLFWFLVILVLGLTSGFCFSHYLKDFLIKLMTR